MKKMLSLLSIAMAFTVVSFAQTTPKKVEEHNLTTDVRNKRADNHAMTNDAAHLKLHDASEDRKDKHADKKAMHRTAKKLKRRGVKHPIVRAKHQIHTQDQADKHKN